MDEVLPRTSGGSAACPGGSAPSRPTTSDGSPNCGPRSAASGSTPWQLAAELTWSRPWDQYSGQMRIFAVTETAAHAHLLERRGLAAASRTRPPAYTARAA